LIPPPTAALPRFTSNHNPNYDGRNLSYEGRSILGEGSGVTSIVSLKAPLYLNVQSKIGSGVI
jgi:hypothetical protein